MKKTTYGPTVLPKFAAFSKLNAAYFLTPKDKLKINHTVTLLSSRAIQAIPNKLFRKVFVLIEVEFEKNRKIWQHWAHHSIIWTPGAN